MNITEARTVIALLRHLDGSHTFDETDLVTSLLTLVERANKALVEQSWAVLLDEDALLDTLTQVAQRFADAGNFNQDWTDADQDESNQPFGYFDDEVPSVITPLRRPVQDAQVGGNVL